MLARAPVCTGGDLVIASDYVVQLHIMLEGCEKAFFCAKGPAAKDALPPSPVDTLIVQLFHCRLNSQSSLSRLIPAFIAAKRHFSLLSVRVSINQNLIYMHRKRLFLNAISLLPLSLAAPGRRRRHARPPTAPPAALLLFRFMTIALMGSNRNSAKMIVQSSPGNRQAFMIWRGEGERG